MAKPRPAASCRTDIRTAPRTVTKMAAQSCSLRLSPRKRTAAGATKMGKVWTMGMVRETSRLAITRKKITALNPPKSPATTPQPAAPRDRPSRGERAANTAAMGMWLTPMRNGRVRMDRA